MLKAQELMRRDWKEVFFHKSDLLPHKTISSYFCCKEFINFLPSSRQMMNYIPELCIKWIEHDNFYSWNWFPLPGIEPGPAGWEPAILTTRP